MPKEFAIILLSVLLVGSIVGFILSIRALGYFRARKELLAWIMEEQELCWTWIRSQQGEHLENWISHAKRLPAARPYRIRKTPAMIKYDTRVATIMAAQVGESEGKT